MRPEAFTMKAGVVVGYALYLLPRAALPANEGAGDSQRRAAGTPVRVMMT